MLPEVGKVGSGDFTKIGRKMGEDVGVYFFLQI